MVNQLILFVLFVNSVGMSFYLGRRGIKWLRDKKLIDRENNEITGKDAIAVAKIYIFFSAICLIIAITLLIPMVDLAVHFFTKSS